MTRWQELSGEERYQVVELVRQGETSIQELCRTFGVSRQTLYRAMEAVDQASMAALEPKRRGRKPRPESEVLREELENEKAELQKELTRWRQKYEISKTILDLERKVERGESLPGETGEKRTRKRRRAKRTKRTKRTT
jgi:transposase-like protein